MTYRIEEVRSRTDLMDFIRFPEWLYRDCPHYVPALRSDQIHALTKAAPLAYCTRKMWLVRNERKEVVGRICAIVNPRYNALYGKKRARFGWFDTIEDFSVAHLLLETAERWAKEQGMDEIHGPLFYNTLGKQGLLVEGFDRMPAFNTLYNYPYYQTFIERLGYEKEFDWLENKFAFPTALPEKVQRVAARLMERYELREADIDVLKKDKARVHDFFQTYSSGFYHNVPNFIPFTDEEIEEEARSVLPYVSSRLSSILVDKNGNVAAFAINFPDLSPALRKCRGRLFPFGWLHLLRAVRRPPEILDLILTGAAPEWQNTGITAVLHKILWDKTKSAGTEWARTNPQAENNPAVHIWRAYGTTLYMRRRCYLKSLKEVAR